MHAIRTLILTPAHGHTYRTDAEVLDDWHNGQPFVALDGPLCSHQDTDGILHHMQKNIAFWNQSTRNIVPLVSCIARIP